MHYIHSITPIIYDNSPTLYDVTFTLCYITLWPYLWHQTLYGYVIFTWYGIRHSVMTTKSLCTFPATMPDITLNVFLTLNTIVPIFWKEVNVCHHSLYIYDTICNTYDITSTLADNTPLFLCHGTNSVYDIICIIYDVTHTVCMRNPALYMTWNTLKLTSLPLHMSSHPLFWTHHTYSVRYHRCHMYSHDVMHIVPVLSYTQWGLYDR